MWLARKGKQANEPEAVQVVRCRDCLLGEGYPAEGRTVYHCNLMRRMMEGSDYCSYGKNIDNRTEMRQ